MLSAPAVLGCTDYNALNVLPSPIYLRIFYAEANIAIKFGGNHEKSETERSVCTAEAWHAVLCQTPYIGRPGIYTAADSGTFSGLGAAAAPDKGLCPSGPGDCGLSHSDHL